MSDLPSAATVAVMLGKRWNAEPFALVGAYSVPYAFVRDGITVESFDGREVTRSSALSFCTILCVPTTWEQIHAAGGVAVPLNEWAQGEQMARLAETPFIVAVWAAGDLRYASFRTFENEGVVFEGSDAVVTLAVDRFRPLRA